MLYKVAASIFLELIFGTAIHASNLSDLPSTPPWRHPLHVSIVMRPPTPCTMPLHAMLLDELGL
jgi:hypothetical protein